jgi:hypothetical protein
MVRVDIHPRAHDIDNTQKYRHSELLVLGVVFWCSVFCKCSHTIK